MLACGSAAAESGEEEPGWLESFNDTTKQSLGDAKELADQRWRRFSEHMGFNKPRHIAAYRGHGNADYVWVRGRVLHNRPYGGPKDDDGWWDNLKATYERWESDEVPGIDVGLEYANQRRTVTTDDEGYYSARFDIDEDFPRTDEVLARIEFEGRILSATHRVFLLDEDAELLIISDVDDTIIHTGLTSLLTSARLTFLNNARTRMPLLGVSPLYKALAAGSSGEVRNPVLYVSNSAWNMYDLLRDFFDMNDLPSGPLLLRDIGLSADTGDHKIDTITELMQHYAPLPAVLIGDSGQHDAEIYSKVVERFPERVAAIYIRDVDPDEDSRYDKKVDAIIESSSDSPATFIRVADSVAIARDAAEAGLIARSALDAIYLGVEVDRDRDTLEEEVMDGDNAP